MPLCIETVGLWLLRNLAVQDVTFPFPSSLCFSSIIIIVECSCCEYCTEMHSLVGKPELSCGKVAFFVKEER